VGLAGGKNIPDSESCGQEMREKEVVNISTEVQKKRAEVSALIVDWAVRGVQKKRKKKKKKIDTRSQLRCNTYPVDWRPAGLSCRERILCPC